MIIDRIAKQRVNVIMLIDTSTSMRGKRIDQVKKALVDIKKKLIDMEDVNINADYYLTLITFSSEAKYLNNSKMDRISDVDLSNLKVGGWSNLHLALVKLEDLLKKESKGGIMPDFGGIAPIIVLLTDGHPTGNGYKAELAKLKKLPWFNVALRYGIAIELNDKRTVQVLREFVGDNGDVIECYDSKMLERIIRIIVITASKVKSETANVSIGKDIGKNSINTVAQLEITENLAETEDWEW